MTDDTTRAIASEPSTPPLVLSVIVPAFRCADMLRASLAGLLASDLPRAQWELIVVDDGSDDETPAVARAVADHVLVTPHGPRGPAFARNSGAVIARAPVLLFVDADVVVAPTTLSGFAHLFASQPDVAAAFGAYDETPGDRGFVSQYRNLLHHYVHRMNPGAASTFWAGCGAVRREAFLAVGGYDHRRYPRPQIEDIELGYRLSARAHRIVLAPELQGTHLKRWTLANMLRTDFRERSIPWMHLLLERGEAIATDGPLNLRVQEKVLTAASGLMLLAVALAVVLREGRWLPVAGVACAAIVMGNWRMLRWFAGIRGQRFAVGVVFLRLLFYVTSGVGAVCAVATFGRRPQHGALPPLRPTDIGVTAIGALHV